MKTRTPSTGCLGHHWSVTFCDSCGYERTATLQAMPDFTIAEARLKEWWGSWNTYKRGLYRNLFALAKPYERKPRQAATWASIVVLDGGSILNPERVKDGCPFFQLFMRTIYGARPVQTSLFGEVHAA